MLRTFEPKKFEKLRTAQPEPKFTGSYKKKRVWKDSSYRGSNYGASTGDLSRF